MLIGVASAAACGQGTTSRPAAPPPQTWRPVAIGGLQPPLIRGGSPAQRRLLARIVRGMRPTQIRTLTIAPAGREWHPLRPGDVELTATEAGAARGHDSSLGDWETWLIGGAFRDRSAALGLPRVVVVAGGSGAERVAGGSAIPPAPAHGMAAFHRRVAAAARASGARVLSVRTGRPDGYSAAVALQVADPIRFLRRRLGPLQRRLDALSSDGALVALYEADGRPLYVGGHSTRLGSGLAGIPDHRYRTCIQYALGEPATLAPPLPCPSGWRPPPDSPPRRLHLYGWEAAGRAMGGGRPGADNVSYLPGATLGLGFVLENPNGHPVTVRAITPTVGAHDPIGYIGARIQVPSSRSTPGMAAELQPPYSPEPPLVPFTIRPGDWVGVGLHYRVARACSAAEAGRRIAENRTLVITSTLQGVTQRRTYPGDALTITAPATCAS